MNQHVSTRWIEHKFWIEQNGKCKVSKQWTNKWCEVVKLPVVLLQMFIHWFILFQGGLHACHGITISYVAPLAQEAESAHQATCRAYHDSKECM